MRNVIESSMSARRPVAGRPNLRARYARISRRLPRRSERSDVPAPGVDPGAAPGAAPPAGTLGARVTGSPRPACDTAAAGAAPAPPARLPGTAPAAPVENAAKEVLAIMAADHRAPMLTPG